MASSKFIVVIDSCHLILYEVRGLKIIKGPDNIQLPFSRHGRNEKIHGSYDGALGNNPSASDPHTMPKEIDRKNSAKIICECLNKLFEEKLECNELIIASDPKMLGLIREYFSKNLKMKITKEVDKDLVNQNILSIERSIFGPSSNFTSPIKNNQQ